MTVGYNELGTHTHRYIHLDPTLTEFMMLTTDVLWSSRLWS